MANPAKNTTHQRPEMLPNDQANDIIIEVENVPSGVQRHLASNQIFLRKPSANPALSMVPSSVVDTIDCQIFSNGNDRRNNRLLRFSSLNESVSQIHHGPECLGIDETCTFHETVQGMGCSGKVTEVALKLSTGCCC